MTDAGEFERLATAVLRQADRAYAPLMHSGVNANGRPVPAPVDGFSLTSSRSTDQVLAAHTTMALSSLARKWLDPQEGDIATAAATARRMGAEGARLVLTSNREPPLELVVSTREACRAAGLRLDIWSQSRLADFLDDNPEGQWIRRRFFGEAETRLSFSGLRSASEAEPSTISLFDPPGALTTRGIAHEVAAKLQDGQRLVLLNAASGQGKTVVATQVWELMVTNGAGAVHVAHEDVDASVTLAEALTRALLRRLPGLTPTAGRELISLAEAHEILVLIEDINRSAHPAAALQKVVSWGRQGSASGLRLLCPIWPRALAGLSEQERKAVAESVVWLELPSEAEATAIASGHAAAQGCSPHPQELFVLVQRLGRDPLLLGLHDYAGGASEGVKGFVVREAARVAAVAGLSSVDLWDALEALAIGMLQARSLEPSWHEVRSWVDGDAASGLLRLLHTGVLLRLGGEGAEERVMFRHDRVRDQIRASGLRRLLVTDREHEVLRDPAYAELWGELLCDPDAPAGWIDHAAHLNPLGLFHGLAACSSSATSRRAALFTAAADWLRQEGAGAERYKHLRWAAQFALIDVEAQEIPELLRLFGESTWMTREAAFLNGDMEAGLRITAGWDPYRLTGREKRLFDHVRGKRQAEARDFVEAGLRDLCAPPNRVLALLAMAGRLRDPALEDVLLEMWRRGPRTPEFINGMLWALLLCAPGRLAPVFDAWADLSEERGEHGSSPRGSVGYDARVGLWELADPEALGALLDRARDHEGPLAWYIGNIIEGWDHPDAQEHYVRQLASIVAKSREEGSGGLVGYRIGEMWSEDDHLGGWTMSDASLERLQGLWSDPDEHEDVRSVALRLWTFAARPRHLQRDRCLQALDFAGPLGAGAVRALVVLNHPDGPAALDRLAEAYPEQGWVWQHVRGRWRDAFLPPLRRAMARRRVLKSDDQLGRFREDFALPEVMLWLDDQTRTQLLCEHWDHLGDEPRWVHLALWTATPETVALARRSLSASEPTEMLRYLSQHYGLYPGSKPPTAQLRRLQALEPWLDYLDDHAFRQIEEHCNRLGWQHWRRAHIDKRLAPGAGAAWRSPGSRRAEFDRIADDTERPPYVRIALEHMLRAEGDAGILLAELDDWLRQRRDLAALRVACAFVVEVGSRGELPRLNPWRLLPLAGGDEVVDDAVFALLRRTLR